MKHSFGKPSARLESGVGIRRRSGAARDLHWLLMQRASLILLVCFGFMLALALVRAGVDVAREEAAAQDSAALMARLWRLQSVPASRIPAELAAMQHLSDGIRHFSFELDDARTGRRLVGPPPDPEPPGLLRRWLSALIPYHAARPRQTLTVTRSDGRSFRASLVDNPSSERAEAADNIAGICLVLLAYSAILWIGLSLALRTAFAPLRLVLDTVRRWQTADFAPRLPPMRVAELDAIGRELNGLAQALESGRDEQRQLSLRIQSLQEDERASLARELHDEFAQSLTAMRANVAWLQRRATDPELRGLAADLDARCADLQLQTRKALRQLRPDGGVVGDGGIQLELMLRSLVDDWKKIPQAGIEFDCDIDVDGAAIPRGLALAIYRITQEAVTNAVRHAQASRIGIRLLVRRPGRIRWAVVDDGRGIADLDEAMRRGSGLGGIRERVWSHGGTMHVDGEHGVTLEAAFPWPRQEAS